MSGGGSDIKKLFPNHQNTQKEEKEDKDTTMPAAP